MRKYVVALLTISLFAGVLFSAPVLAYNPFSEACNNAKGADGSSVCSSQNNTGNPVTGSDGVILKVVNLVSILAGVAAVFIIVFGGIQYVLSSGDSAKVGLAKDTILYAVIGLVVVVLARTIITLVINRL